MKFIETYCKILLPELLDLLNVLGDLRSEGLLESLIGRNRISTNSILIWE
jgi:hypothetical protein